MLVEAAEEAAEAVMAEASSKVEQERARTAAAEHELTKVRQQLANLQQQQQPAQPAASSAVDATAAIPSPAGSNNPKRRTRKTSVSKAAKDGHAA